MNILQNYILQISPLVSFALYFIFNFLDRSVSNIFLLLTLLLCIINYKAVYYSIIANSKLFITIIVFSLYISLIGIYHNSALNELDNYYRFLLLLPLLSLSINESRMVALICASAAAGLFHAFYSDMFSNIINYSSISNLERYQGTSNTSITYGNMCATLFLIASYYIFYRGNKSYHLILSAIIFLILFILTAARGPLVGIILGLSYLFFVITYDSNRRSNLKYFIAMLSIFLIIIIVIPNPMVERLKNIKHVDLTQPFQIEHISLRERVFMFNFSIEQIQDKYIMGVGPQNVQDRMDDSLNLKAPSMFLDSKIGNIYSKDHLHNDLLDITLKFGLISLILLLFIYFYLINSKNTEHRVLLYMLMIMLVSSQMTQSHFAHHQAITFYIILFYLFQSKVNRITK